MTRPSDSKIKKTKKQKQKQNKTTTTKNNKTTKQNQIKVNKKNLPVSWLCPPGIPQRKIKRKWKRD